MTIAVYSRKSKFTGKGESIANQVALCRQEAQRYLERKGIAASDASVLVYEDEGFSGKNTARPEFQRMMAAVRGQEINCVICYKLDRISRNVGDFALTYEEFERYGVDFLCVNEKYDTSAPAGRAMMGMVSVFAQLERETTAERIRDNMHMLARTGRWLGGRTPTGFRSQKETRADAGGKTRSAYKLVPVAEEIELVRLIYQKFLETGSVAGAARYLAQSGFRTRTGRDFTHLGVKEILRNPVYCVAEWKAGEYFRCKGAELCYEDHQLDGRSGFMPYNRTTSGKNRQMRTPISDWLIAVGGHGGVIPAEDWVKAQLLLDAKREKSKLAVRTPYRSEALLSGLLFCGICGSAMRPHAHTSRKTADGKIPYYYICELKELSAKKRCAARNVNGSLLDQRVMDELLRHQPPDVMVKQSLRMLSKRLSGQKDSAASRNSLLERELAKKQRQMERLIETLGNGSVGDAFEAQVRMKVNELADQCRRLQSEAEPAVPTSGPAGHGESPVEAVTRSLRNLRDRVAAATATEKREFLRTAVERIVWDGERAHIYLPDEPQTGGSRQEQDVGNQNGLEK